MYRRLTEFVLRWLRVPPRPQPPHGDPASLRVFRAGDNFLRLRLVRWGTTQLIAMIGVIFWFGVFSDLENEVERIRQERARPQPAATTPAPTPSPATGSVVQETAPKAAKAKRRAARRNGGNPWRPIDSFYAWQYGTASFLARLPKLALSGLWVFETAGLILYFVQLPVTLILARMDFDLRWYMVTDRSLRIRHGVWNVAESTMSFANIQQVVVSQGPLQRLLGLADVRVQSAGGGGHSDPQQQDKAGEDLHSGLFHAVTNATEIRDLILERLRHFREAGLGDPDDKRAVTEIARPLASPGSSAADAARELLAEAKALRTAAL